MISGLPGAMQAKTDGQSTARRPDAAACIVRRWAISGVTLRARPAFPNRSRTKRERQSSESAGWSAATHIRSPGRAGEDLAAGARVAGRRDSAARGARLRRPHARVGASGRRSGRGVDRRDPADARRPAACDRPAAAMAATLSGRALAVADGVRAHGREGRAASDPDRTAAATPPDGADKPTRRARDRRRVPGPRLAPDGAGPVQLAAGRADRPDGAWGPRSEGH